MLSVYRGAARGRPAIATAVKYCRLRLGASIAALVFATSFAVLPARADGGDSGGADVQDVDTYAADAGDAGPDTANVTSVSSLDDFSAAGNSSALSIEGLVFARKKIGNFPLTTLRNNAAAKSYTPFMSTEMEGEDYTVGMRGALQADMFDQPFEFSAFYLNPIGIEKTKLGLSSGSKQTDTIYDDAPGSDISSVNSDNIYGLVAHHETKLLGAEINMVRPLGIPGVTLGARAIYFGEHFTSTTIDTINDMPGGSSSARDHVGVRTDNRLVGVQLGLQHMFDLGQGLSVGGSIKGGLYNNYVDRNRTFLSENRPDLRSFEDSRNANVFAQAVEINPRVEFKLSDSVYLTAAGTFLWLNNVSTALPHYRTVEDLDGDRDVRANASTYFYGGSLGLKFLFDAPSAPASPYGAIATADDWYPGTSADIEDRIAALEESTAEKGNRKVSLRISGSINRMFMMWDDGAKKDVYIVDNTAARSRIEFNGAVKIARGWSAGYLLSVGLDDRAANDVSQISAQGDDQIQVRHSAWWVRNSQLGTVTMGYTSPATDNIILKDVGGIMPGAQNIATIGGSFAVRRADSYEIGDGALIDMRTTLNDFSAGASVDTLRRNVVRYDAPRISSQWGNIDLSAAWGEDDFTDFAVEYGINYNDWKFRAGAGYLHDTDESGRANSSRDRQEYKGSASLLHIPTGLFGTAAYVRREFNGFDTSNQAVFGENTVGIVTPPGTNRPPIDYLYTAAGIRRGFWSMGETSVYGEFAQVDDAIRGLREAGLREVTKSRLTMVGAAVSQDITDAGMDLYAGFRLYSFDVEGVQVRSNTPTGPSPVPLTDLAIGYAGTRIKF